MLQRADVEAQALALGADRAILIETDVDLQPLAVAKLLKAIVEEEKPAPAPKKEEPPKP